MMHFFFQLWLVREVQWKIHIFCPPEIRTAPESQLSQLSARLKRLSKTPLRPETRNQTWWRCGRNLGDHTFKNHSKNDGFFILLGWFKFPQEAGEPFKAKASSPNRELILRITSLDKNCKKNWRFLCLIPRFQFFC